MKKISVVLADDHLLVREGISHLIKSFGEFEIVGQASDGLEAVRIVKEFEPDILVVDITMPKLRGVEVITHARTASPQTKIIVLSMHNKNKYIKACLQNGASAYLLKESAVDELKSAMECVMADQIYLSPAISKSIVKDWLSPDSNGDASPLTAREREILKLLAEGHTNKEIAAMLFISPKTVETHRHRINEKLNLGNVADLVRYAIKEGLTSV